MSPKLAPLMVLSGAPGAGKTTLLPDLVRAGRAAGGLVVADVDELLEGSALLGVPIATAEAEPDWPAYDRLWRRILAMPRRAGHPVLMLGPWTPADPGAADDASDWAVLDCSDQTRTARLRARGWPAEQIVHALADARDYRAAIATSFSSDADSPALLAQRIVAWAVDRASGPV